ncbi:hypothetical protein [Tenacibaculum sp. nBUS_03]|uniref:hypothetical protein n=1 Tax=Tenacibaculum sp. nBUS_03 TaxID=3395320 RepID=UPI003EBA56FB
MELQRISFSNGILGEHLKEFFNHKESQLQLQFGTVHLKKGTRIPEEGFTKHEQKKIVCLLEGKVKLLLENDPKKHKTIQSGDAFMIDYYEGHGGIILEDVKLLYVLFGATSKTIQ